MVRKWIKEHLQRSSSEQDRVPPLSGPLPDTALNSSSSSAGASQATQKVEIRTWASSDDLGSFSGELEAIEPSRLKPVAVLAQAPDNQWVPRQLLQRMLDNPPQEGLKSVAPVRDPQVRTEYLRALVNTQQVVLNRAYLYNTSAISQDYELDSSGHPPAFREQFKTLLSEGVIVPYLLREQTPADLPRGLDLRPGVEDFGFNRKSFVDWRELLRDVRAQCVRLSWDDSDNITLTNVMFASFQNRVTGMRQPLTWGDPARYLADCGVSTEERQAFEQRLKDVYVWAGDNPVFGREHLYKEFVVAPGTNVSEGRYDRSKPYCYALKQLFDLNYSVNLTDALGLSTLTPIDALSRTSLQELTVLANLARTRGEELDPDDVVKLVRQLAFGLVQGGLYLKSMGDLTLQDVLDIRATDEWHAYIQTVQRLLTITLKPSGNPGDANTIKAALGRGIGGEMEAIYKAYDALARVMTQQVTKNHADVAVERWAPLATLVIDLGGALLTAAIVPAVGLGPAFVYGFLGNIVQDKVGAVARLLIRGNAALGAQAALESSLDFMKVKLKHAKELIKTVGEETHIPLLEEAGFTYVPNLFERLTRQYDQAINYPEELQEAPQLDDPALAG